MDCIDVAIAKLRDGKGPRRYILQERVWPDNYDVVSQDMRVSRDRARCRSRDSVARKDMGIVNRESSCLSWCRRESDVDVGNIRLSAVWPLARAQSDQPFFLFLFHLFQTTSCDSSTEFWSVHAPFPRTAVRVTILSYFAERMRLGTYIPRYARRRYKKFLLAGYMAPGR